MSNEKKGENITERVLVACTEVVDHVKGLIAEGRVRRLVIRKPDGDLLLNVPLIAGAAVSGLLVILAPVLVAIGAMAALIARVQVEVVRDDDQP